MSDHEWINLVVIPVASHVVSMVKHHGSGTLQGERCSLDPNYERFKFFSALSTANNVIQEDGTFSLCAFTCKIDPNLVRGIFLLLFFFFHPFNQVL